MVGTPVAIGPFFGGLNDVNDPSSIEDEQCSELLNFDIDVDGSIVSRPGFKGISYGSLAGMLAPIAQRPLGTLHLNDQTFAIVSYIDRLDSYREKIAALDIDTNLVTVIQNNPSGVEFIAALQYDNKLWILSPADPVNSGWWTPTGGWTSVGAIPRGIAFLMYKERMFVARPDGRVYFSRVGDPTKWDSWGFYDVNPGDGQKIMAMISHMGQIIIFKEHSTYVLSYDSAPENATIQQVSSTIGTNAINSVTVHENIIYTFHGNTLYAINNWRWQDVSSHKVRIFDPPDSDYMPKKFRSGISGVFTVGRRVIVRHRTKFWIYYPDMDAWSTWSRKPIGSLFTTWDIFLPLPKLTGEGYAQYLVGNSVQRDVNDNYLDHSSFWYYFIDGYVTDGGMDLFPVAVASKMYDYDTPYNFKRLHWWGVDLLSKKTVNVEVFPETFNTQITWDQLENMNLTWDQLTLNGSTWNRLADISVNVTDSYSMNYQNGVRSFIKWLKSLRFRKIVFRLSSEHDGSLYEGPLRIFTAMALVTNKQLGPRKAN